jgi:hypothetical protein
MRASKSISDLGVFLAEPVLERSKALNDAGARLRESASRRGVGDKLGSHR